jgi:hypothetical protein
LEKELQNITGLKLPKVFINLMGKFSEKFGGIENGIKKFCDYTDSSFVKSSDARGYEHTPVEFLPFLSLGFDGIHIGFCNLLPELEFNDLPLIEYIPGTGEVYYIGSSTCNGIENIISTVHSENKFKDIDLTFLNSIGIFPSKEQDNYYSLDYIDCAKLWNNILPNDYKFIKTHDSIGVCAPKNLFSDKNEEWDFETDIATMIKTAESNLTNGFLASALVNLKEIWWLKFHKTDEKKMKEVLELKIETYRKLGRNEYAEILKQEFSWL